MKLTVSIFLLFGLCLGFVAGAALSQPQYQHAYTHTMGGTDELPWGYVAEVFPYTEAASEPTLDRDYLSLWYDNDDDRYWLVWNQQASPANVQVKVEFAPGTPASANGHIWVNLGNDATWETYNLHSILTQYDTTGVFTMPTTDDLFIDCSKAWPGGGGESGLKAPTIIVGSTDATYGSLQTKDIPTKYLCDGVADQAEINYAISDLSTSGGWVHVLDGTYFTTDEILITKSNVTLTGVGEATVIRPDTGATITYGAITVGEGVNVYSHVNIANLQISDPDGHGGYGIVFRDYVEYSEIVNVTVQGAVNDGIYLETCHRCGIFQSNVLNSTQCGIFLNDCSYSTVSLNQIKNTGDTGIEVLGSNIVSIVGNTIDTSGEHGIYLYNSNYCLIQSNTSFSNTWSGIAVNHYGSIRVSDNATIGNSYNGIAVCTVGDGIVTGNYSTGNLLDGIALSGLWIACTGNQTENNLGDGISCTASHSAIVGNQIYSNGERGINNSGKYVTITGNQLNNNSFLAGIYAEIRMADADWSAVVGNTIVDDGVVKAAFGIWMDDACSGVKVVGNVITGPTVAASIVTSGYTQWASEIPLYPLHLDLAYDGSNEAFALDTLAVTNDTGLIVTEPTPDTVLFNFGEVCETDENEIITGDWDFEGGFFTPLSFSEFFWNCQVASTIYVHAAISGTGVLQTITGSITNPDVPRNISVMVSSLSDPTATVTIAGVSAKGVSLSEAVTITSGATVYTNNAFARVTSFTIPVEMTSADTVSIGISDKFGLANDLVVNTNVYKVNVNGSDVYKQFTIGDDFVCAYDTVNMASLIAGLQAGDDVTIWYTIRN